MNGIRLERLLAATLFVGVLFSGPVWGRDDQPNIVLVLMDNFGWGEIGAYGGGELRGAPTPNIDSIAAEGFRLTNYNVEAECTPSRASLLTGKESIRAILASVSGFSRRNPVTSRFSP